MLLRATPRFGALFRACGPLARFNDNTRLHPPRLVASSHPGRTAAVGGPLWLADGSAAPGRAWLGVEVDELDAPGGPLLQLQQARVGDASEEAGGEEEAAEAEAATAEEAEAAEEANAEDGDDEDDEEGDDEDAGKEEEIGFGQMPPEPESGLVLKSY